MLSSFSLCGTPHHLRQTTRPGLFAHRFRSVWSAEGRLESTAIEDLHLERSWSGAGAFSERFARSVPCLCENGSRSVPRKTGKLRALALAWAGSWQMEIFRQHDDVCLSGGLADREFGH